MLPSEARLQLLDIDRANCEESLYVFLKSAWHVFDSAPWCDGWCIDAIAEHLQAVIDGEIRRLVINIPPRCSKSALCSVALTGWTWAQKKISHTSGPGVSFLYASFREDLSVRDSSNCRKVIESKWYQERWGDRFTLADDQNTKRRFNNSSGGYRLVTSIESKGATGDGANIIVLDDCNSPKEVESEAIIASTTDWFDGTMGTRLNSQKLGAIIEIQQRVGEQDITGHIMSKSKGEWTYLILPMEFEADRAIVTSIGWQDPRKEEGELLWPERFGPEEVIALKDWMGPWRSAGQLQQRPEPKGGGLIERAWWQLWEPDVFPKFDFVLGCLDTAYTEDQLNDPSGLLIWGVFSEPIKEVPSRVANRDPTKAPIMLHPSDSRTVPRVCLMYAWERRLRLHELVTQVAESCSKWKVDVLLIENKASGISVAQELRRLFANSRWAVQLCDPKSQDKVSRLISVQHLFAEGLIFAPTEKYPWVEMVIKQVEQFPKGKHDEFVDCTSMGLRYLRDNGIICRVVEREAEIESQKAYRRREEPLYGGI